MSKSKSKSKSHHIFVNVWSVAGKFQQLIFSPKGAIEGLLIDTDGIPTQFVTDPEDAVTTQRLCELPTGAELVVEGTEADVSPKGEPAHTVYYFERLVSIDGIDTAPVADTTHSQGKVVRLNYARHGAANGVILDNGNFIHTRPEGMETLGLKPGDVVTAEGKCRQLITGSGVVIEANTVNGHTL